MARPAKKGLDYFSHDTDASTSREVEYLEAKYGLIGYALFFKILEKIYGHEGYYIPWTEIDASIFAKHCGVEKHVLDGVVEICLELDLFSRWVYDANKVLTSASIQRRYLQATEKRAKVEIVSKFNLTKNIPAEETTPKNDSTGVSAEKTHVSVEETRIKSSESTQSKVKESKRKKKNKTSSDFSLPDWVPGEDWDGYVEMRDKIKKPMTARAKTMAVKELIKLKESGNDPGEVLRQSVFNSWQGLFAVKNKPQDLRVVNSGMTTMVAGYRVR